MVRGGNAGHRSLTFKNQASNLFASQREGVPEAKDADGHCNQCNRKIINSLFSRN